MPVFGVTGGIATGKSTFVRALIEHIPAEVFDADASAAELLKSDPGVREAVLRAFGPAAFQQGGAPNRAHLREAVFGDAIKRGELEAILHPAIRVRWLAKATAYREADMLIVDLPLLFETGAQSQFDRVIVAACSPHTQMARLCERRGLKEDLAKRMVGAQLELSSKIAQADHLVWNDSTPAALRGQAELLSRWLQRRYG